MHDMLLCLPFTDGALIGHFGKVRLEFPPLSVAVKLLCLQHVRKVECRFIRGCEVSISVRCNDDSSLASLDPIRTYFTIPILYFKSPSILSCKTSPTPICAQRTIRNNLICTPWRPCTFNCKPHKTLYWCTRSMTCD